MTEYEKQRIFDLTVLIAFVIIQLTYLSLYWLGLQTNLWLAFSPTFVILTMAGLIYFLFLSTIRFRR